MTLKPDTYCSPMKELLRETVFGRLVHLTTGGKLFGYDEESDALAIQKRQSIDNQSPTILLNHHGEHFGPKGNKILGTEESPDAHQGSSIPSDLEKGNNYLLVRGTPNDSHNPRNWSTPKNVFVTFQMCLLTTSIYVGSAIYIAGLPGLESKFHISTVKSLLGLTLFMIG